MVSSAYSDNFLSILPTSSHTHITVASISALRMDKYGEIVSPEEGWYLKGHHLSPILMLDMGRP